ncbi:2-hydroxyacid dehydrogenase [Gandjariella thermophila]|uniref:Dehydrogenase n=1 Tax=Gandjariella thermophila TaxID=1931992 RepID=A0A4D4JEM8_9PSEU|nr:2-hydroxyacid dehydrogenase [Gandjariella thermophila]GDY32367.1 dehydrogenase [Gandjariella thermophila]
MQDKPRVLVPFSAEDLGGFPAGLRVDTWDGTGDPPRDLADVAMYVLPYAGGQNTTDVLAEMSGLRVAQSLTAGVERLLPLLPPHVVLCNGRGLHDASAAEHALALILAAQRDLPRWVRDQDAHRWAPHFTRSLAGSRVLILGYGSIGAALDTRLRACEAEVVRVARARRPAEHVHGIAELPDLLPHADILVSILPDTDHTRGLLGAKELALLPDEALVVNIGRGTAVDTLALVAETASGRLRVALDVTDPEPPPAEHPLWSAANVLITPHVAGGSATFYPRARRFVADQLRRFAEGRDLRNVVPRD